jgi:signal transduction histidine kinase/ligand-binding sensor domain-containing protein
LIATCRALALEPGQPATSYLRKDFTIEDGLPANEVRAIVQTQNGFLWVGTDGGLSRFDGKRFTPINIRGGVAQQIPVRFLLTTSKGDLWVGTDAGLARIPSAALDHFDRALLTIYHVGVGLSDQILCMHLSRAGTLWVGTSGGLYRFDRGHFLSVIPHEMISRIEENSDGHLLIITGDGFVEWDGIRVIPHPEIAQQLGVATNEVFHVYEDHKGVTWFCTNKGVARRVGGRITKLEPYGLRRDVAWRVYEDPQGNIWVMAQLGLFRATANGLEPIPGLDPRFLYSDREGDLWVSNENAGLIRLKHRVVWMYTTSDGLPNNRVRTVLRSREGTLWVGNDCGGISRFDGKRFHNYDEKDGLSNSCVWAMAEDTARNLWIGTWGGGLYRFRNGHFTQYSVQQGLPSTVVVSIVAAADGSLWIATSAGLSRMQNGHLRNYSIADGLSSDLITTVYQDRSGTIWVGTSVGLDRLVGDRFVAVPRDASSSDTTFRALRDASPGDLYAFSEVNGISRFENNRFVSVNETLAWGSMIESRSHDLWFAGRQGIFRLAAGGLRKAEQDRESPLDYSSFGPDDGMNSKECDGWGQPNMAITSDDSLWVATVKGLARLDLRGFPLRDRKPAIYMEEVDVGRKKASPGREIVLPPGTYHVEFHFTAVDLVSPEKIRLQYRLDGVEPLWLDADSSRTAIYNDIPVGSHSFHIRACNRDGVWDRTGISFPVTQKPYFYQATWFRVGTLMAFVLTLIAAYRLRLHKIRAQMNERFHERVEERTRIARDLHDTLLQSFQGLMLRLQAVHELMPDGTAKKQLQQTLKRADQAITEGRSAVYDLRSSTTATNDFPQAVRALGTELSTESPVAFRLAVEGRPRESQPIIRDELYRITREALRNAFDHARAHRIEVEISYGERLFRLRIRDDGEGIPPEVLTQGRPGHYGLNGMRERAEQIGAKFVIWNGAAEAGTEIELTLSSSIAYRDSENRFRFWPFREKVGER